MRRQDQANVQVHNYNCDHQIHKYTEIQKNTQIHKYMQRQQIITYKMAILRPHDPI